MAFGARLGAGNDEDPVGELGQRRPDFLPVHDPLPIDEIGAGLHVGEIGAGVGFGVALAPEFVTREDLRHEPLLLRLGAERHQGRAEQGDTHVGNASRRLGLDIGEVEDDLFGKRALTAADRGGKVDAEPATCGEFLLPRNLDFRRDVLVAGETLAAVGPELAGEMLLQPGADLVAEVVQGVIEPDVHSVRAYNPT